jgi:DNA repair protein RadC
MNQKKNHLTVKELPEEMRPRERLFEQGAAGLSDVELIAIIIRTGTRDETSLKLAERLLQEFGSLGKISHASLEELLGFYGIGRAKAAQLIACVELGKRLSKAGLDARRPITSPEQLAHLLMLEMRYLDREHFKAVILNTKNHVVKIVDISIGSLNSSIVHPRELFKMVLKHSGAALIVAHNHPSGDPEPSSEDIRLTKRLSEAGKILGIDLLDHLILGDGKFVSLKERGII